MLYLPVYMGFLDTFCMLKKDCEVFKKIAGEFAIERFTQGKRYYHYKKIESVYMCGERVIERDWLKYRLMTKRKIEK